MTEQEHPRTDPAWLPDAITYVREEFPMTVEAIEDAARTEGRQQAVREIRDHNDYDKMPVRLRAHIDRVAGASESPNNNPGGEDHTLQVLPDDSFYCLKCQQVVPPDHSALDTNERPGPFDLAELTGTIEDAPIGHLQTALGGNGEPLALWIKRMYGQRLRVRDASESPLCPDCGNDMRYAGHPVPWRRCGDASESPPTGQYVITDEKAREQVWDVLAAAAVVVASHSRGKLADRQVDALREALESVAFLRHVHGDASESGHE